MSIALGPQGYAAPPPTQIVVPVTVEIVTVPPPPQPALEVTASEAQDPEAETREDGKEKDKAFDPHGPRRGKLLDIRS
jgi:hypothetical protein